MDGAKECPGFELFRLSAEIGVLAWSQGKRPSHEKVGSFLLRPLKLMPARRIPYDIGGFGDPASTNQRDYLLILFQLLKRMRLDLEVTFVITVFLLNLRIPESWLLSTQAVSVLGIAVSIFIGFRNTQAISRWWEARTLWGAIVNVSRGWNDALRAHLDDDQWQGTRARSLVQLQVALIWQLNFELRNFWHRDLRTMQLDLLKRLDLSDSSTVRSLSVERCRQIQHLFRDGWIDERGRFQLTELSITCMDAVGGLERIRNTPIPPPYDMFVRLINVVFGTQLLLDFNRSGSPATGILLFLGFLMAERIGAYVEGPFDQDGSSFSMPLNTICTVISNDLMEGELDFGRFETYRNPVFWD